MMDQDRDGVLSRADLVAIFNNIGKFSWRFSTFNNFWEKKNNLDFFLWLL